MRFLPTGIIVLISCVLNISPIAAGTQFVAGGTFPVGTGPRFVALADFNKDGKLDAAVANYGSDNISILIGNGDGTFQSASNYNVKANSKVWGLAVADLNGDGKLDIVVTPNSLSEIEIFFGNGDGTFQTQFSSVPVQRSPISVAAADLNGDGKMDLAVVNHASDTVSILLGNGNGTFQSQVTYPIGVQARWVVIADFDHDQKLDLAVVNGGDNNVAILLGHGDGTFASAVNFPTGNVPVSLVAGRFNNDNDVDLVSADFKGDSGIQNVNTVSTLLGNGNGSFQPPAPSNVGAAPFTIASGDFNGDGNLDVVTANQNSSNITVLRGNGNGTFQSGVNFPAGSGSVAVDVGDLNNDGAPDLVVGNAGANNVEVFYNTGGTRITTSSSPDPSHIQQQVTFMTTVQASIPGSPDPTGNVIFYDGTNPLGTAPLNSGQAILKISSLSAGTHVIKAVYLGDNNFNPHAAASIRQLVSALTPRNVTF